MNTEPLTEREWMPDGQQPPEPDAPEDEQLEAELAFNRSVSEESHRLRVRDAANRLVKRESRGEHARPQGFPLPAFLDVVDEDSTFRIDGLWPTGGRGILAAQYKAGKSTMVGNLVRCLVDGDPFLGAYTVHPAGKVILIDNELDPRTLRRWLRDQDISNKAAIGVIPLRGKVSSFDLLDGSVRTEWATLISGADVVILDCLRPVLDALGLDENRDAGRFLVAFDALLNEAGVSEAVIVHHMGHSGERSRGDSRILDWPDVTWKLVREDGEDPSSARYFSAFGRDVDVAESKLSFDPSMRRLSIAGGTRRESKADEAIPAILGLLQEKSTLSGRQVEAEMHDSEHTQKAIRTALRRAHEQHLTITYGGQRGAVMHSLNPNPPINASVRSSALPVRQRGQSECVSASIDDALHSHNDNGSESGKEATHSECTKHPKTPRPDICQACKEATS